MTLATMLAQRMDPDDMMGGRWHDGTGWWWIVGLVLVLVLIAVVAVLLVKALRPPTRPVAGSGPVPAVPRSSAEDLLAERLARGEIDPAEYHERLSALRGG